MPKKYIENQDTKDLKRLEEFFTTSKKMELFQNDKSIIQRYILSIGEKVLYIKKGRNEYILCGQNITGTDENKYGFESMKENYDIYEHSKDLEFIREKFIFLALKNLHMLDWGSHISEIEKDVQGSKATKPIQPDIEYEMPLY